MKVLYTGHFEENSGWADAATNIVESMISVGIDVKILSIKLTSENKRKQFSTDIIKASEISKNYQPTHCIQHVLPHHLCISKKFKKNIAYYVEEGVSYKRNVWHESLNKMDEVWVPNNDLKQNLSSILDIGIKVVPHTFATSIYEKEYENLLNISDKLFTFYSICDFNDRKNLETLLYCYGREFSIRDNVQLIIKVRRHQTDPQQMVSMFNDLTKKVFSTARFRDVNDNPRIRVITQSLSDEQILSLHQYSNCFVSASHGEAWGIPAYEAMCFGKTPICGNEGGPKDFIDADDSSTGCLVDGNFVPARHGDPAFPHVLSGNSDWFNIDEKSLSKKMRWYYENQDSINYTKGIAKGKNFDYQVVGEKIKELLYAN